MYEEIEMIINGGNYNLSDLLHRIDILYARGSLTDEEHLELTTKAREKADQSVVYPPVEERIMALELWRKDVEERLVKLEEDAGEPIDLEPVDEYPAWVQPTGAHDAYYTGDKMTYTDGNRYTCIAPENYGVTYGPDVLPSMWQNDGPGGA